MDTPPKIRNDLIIREIAKSDGSKYFVIKDPITNAFFQVGEAEYFVICNFDGVKTVVEIATSVRSKFETEIEAESISSFASQLQELCFLDNDLTRQELLKKQRMVGRGGKKTIFGRLLYIKLKAINPGKLFDVLIEHIRFFFTSRFVWTANVLILLAIVVSLYNSHSIANGFYNLLNPQGIVIFYLSMFVVIVTHEFAHGLTCRFYGGTVQDIGFLLLYFQPAFYCNVSDAWLFPDKSKRLWVSFSGAFFQLFVWALAVFVWRVTSEDILINKIAVAILSFSGIALLFNFNPLLKYDGYYLLSDYLEIPNLRQKAGNYWRNLFRGILLRSKSGMENLPPREQRIYFYYGILSFIYIVFVLGYFFLIVGKFLVSRLGGTGFIIFAAILVFLFRNIIVDAIKGTGEMVKARKSFFKKWTTGIPVLAIIVIVIAFIVFGSWELRIKGELVVNPIRSLILNYNSAGYAELVQYESGNEDAGQKRDVSIFSSNYNSTTRLLPLVKTGDKVIEGQVIAKLVNSQTSQLVSEYAANLQKAAEELSLLKQGPRTEEIEEARNNLHEMEAQLRLSAQALQRKNDMQAKGLISKQDWEDAHADSSVWDARLKGAQNRLLLLKAGTRPEEIKAKEAEISRLKSQIEFQSRQLESYEVKSAINGVVLNVDTGSTVCEVANIDTMEAKITLTENELADIAVGEKAKFKVRSYPSLSFYGVVYGIESKIETDFKGNRIFQVLCRVPNEDNILKPGMTGIASIYCGDKKISYHIYRKFFRTIRTEFWDWFDWL